MNGNLQVIGRNDKEVRPTFLLELPANAWAFDRARGPTRDSDAWPWGFKTPPDGAHEAPPTRIPLNAYETRSGDRGYGR